MMIEVFVLTLTLRVDLCPLFDLRFYFFQRRPPSFFIPNPKKGQNKSFYGGAGRLKLKYLLYGSR